MTMADRYKSCDALKHEYESLGERPREIADENLSGTDYFHRGVVGAGAALSLTPASLFSPYLYVLPVMTIWYYNHFIGSDQVAEQAERENKRLKDLEMLLREKNCNEDGN